MFLTAIFLFLSLSVFTTNVNAEWNEEQRQYALDYHNQIRAQVARGEVEGQPPAADMNALTYDDRLEEGAQKQASGNCGKPLQHDTMEDREFYPYKGNVGQNTKECQNPKNYNYVKEGMEAFFVEHKKYQYQPMSQAQLDVPRGEEIGHYTALVWAKTHLVGCGHDNCDNADMGYFTCNYAEIGNRVDKSGQGDFPYKQGAPCSACQASEGFTMCMDKALCAKKAQCDSSKSPCECLVDKEKCAANNGIFEDGNCKCDCPKGKSGLNCEEPCEDDPEEKPGTCEQYYNYCANPGAYEDWLGQVCRKTCDYCNNPVIPDHEESNKYYITTNSKITADESKFGKVCFEYACSEPEGFFCEGESFRKMYKDYYIYKCTCGIEDCEFIGDIEGDS